MNTPPPTAIDRIILLIAGAVGGVAAGGVAGAVAGLLTVLSGAGVHLATALLGFGAGVAIGCFVGAIGGFLLAVVYMMIASRVAGVLAGAVVGALVPVYLNAGAFVGTLGLPFFLASVVSGAVAGYMMMRVFESMDTSVSRCG